MSSQVYAEILKNANLRIFVGVTAICVAPLLVHTLFYTPKRMSYRATRREQKNKREENVSAGQSPSDLDTESYPSGGGCPFLSSTSHESSLPHSSKMEVSSNKTAKLYNPREVLAKYKRDNLRVIGLCKFRHLILWVYYTNH